MRVFGAAENQYIHFRRNGVVRRRREVESRLHHTIDTRNRRRSRRRPVFIRLRNAAIFQPPILSYSGVFVCVSFTRWWRAVPTLNVFTLPIRWVGFWYLFYLIWAFLPNGHLECPTNNAHVLSGRKLCMWMCGLTELNLRFRTRWILFWWRINLPFRDRLYYTINLLYNLLIIICQKLTVRNCLKIMSYVTRQNRIIKDKKRFLLFDSKTILSLIDILDCSFGRSTSNYDYENLKCLIKSERFVFKLN